MTHQRIPYDPEEFRQLWATDKSVWQIAAHFGAKRNWASKQAQLLGLPGRTLDSGSLPRTAIVNAYVVEGKTCDEIRDELRVKFPTLSHTTIRRALLDRGVKLRRACVRQKCEAVDCVRMFRKGYSRKAIAIHFGVSLAVVSNKIRQLLGAGPRGKAKSIRVDVATVERLRVEGLTFTEIGQRFGCSRETVSVLLRKQREVCAC